MNKKDKSDPVCAFICTVMSPFVFITHATPAELFGLDLMRKQKADLGGSDQYLYNNNVMV